jgi:protein-tyrosine phosphatase
MAEGLFKQMLAEQGLSDRVAVDSAGCGGWHEGELPDTRMQAVAERRGLELSSRARQLLPKDLFNFDYVIVMDRANLAHVHQMAASRRSTAHVHLMRTFDPAATEAQPEVDDPYTGGMAGFEEVYNTLARSLEGFLNYLRRQHGLQATG